MKAFRRLAFIFVACLSCLIGCLLLWVIFHRDVYLWNNFALLLLVLLPATILGVILLVCNRVESGYVNITLAAMACAVALYLSELSLIIAGPYITLPAEYDRRTKLEVVLEMRSHGESAVPSAHPKNIIPGSLDVNGRAVLPLSGIANANTVFCNETGKYYIFNSDEYGFTNPHGLYHRGIDLGLIGDSFTQGFCAPNGASYADQIRVRMPQTLNLGNNGDGPLVELATLREYLAQLKPKYVFWFYFEGNDMEDLSRELAHPVLAKYLSDPNFTQKLVENSSENDLALRKFVEDGIDAESNKSFKQRFVEEFPEEFNLWAHLWHIRALIGLTDLKREWPLRHWNSDESDKDVQAAFNQILSEAKRLTEGWGGRFVFVYLPSYRTFGYSVTHPWRDRVLQSLRDNNIATIDMLSTFKELPDPIGMYNFRKEGHFTPAGNALVAQKIFEYLTAHGGVALNNPPSQVAPYNQSQVG